MPIDLRAELKELFQNDEGGTARWVLIRHFTNEHSEFWKETTGESVGGPAFKFVDTLVEAYSTSSRSDGMDLEKPMSFDDDTYRFFFEYDIVIKDNDEIFELDYYKREKPTIVYKASDSSLKDGKVMPVERYKVKKTDNLRCDEGRIEYKVAYADKTIYR